MLVVVAVEAQQLPVAAVGRVVLVVVVAVVDGELAQVRRRELARAAAADPRIDLQRLLAVTLFARLAVAQRLGNHPVGVRAFGFIGGHGSLLSIMCARLSGDCMPARDYRSHADLDQGHAHFLNADTAMHADQRVALLAGQPVGDRPVVLHHQRVVADPPGKPQRIRWRAEPTGVDQIRAGMQLEGSIVPRFDLAIASSLAEMDQIIRPLEGIEFSILRPRGAILFTGSSTSALTDALNQKSMEIRTSRCGDFHRTMKLLSEQPEIAATFEKDMITHKYKLDSIRTAFETAADSNKSVKVIVEAS